MKKTLPLLLPILGLYAIALSFNNELISKPSSTDNIVINSLDEGMIYMPASFDSNPSDEPEYSRQQGLVYNHINMGSTWDLYRGDKVKVAVIDTGINTTHEDFYLNGVSHISDKSLNTYYSNPTTNIHGGHTHGTQTSATIFSQFNKVGTAGIAPNVEFIFFKVADNTGAMPYDGIERALKKCLEYDVDVINLSLQGYKHTVSYGGTTQQGYALADSVLKSELQSCYDAGISIVAAAGNYNTDEPSYPAAFDTVISVGSLYNSSSTQKAGYSNYGETIDLVAPGSVYEPNMSGNNTYSSTQGTSFSSPIVAGAIALYKSKYPSATPAEVKQQLLATCDPLADSSDTPGWAGNGRLNVANFLDNGPEEVRVGVTDITCSTSSISMEDKSTYQINASAFPNNATKKGLRYYSSDTSIATVDLSTGLIKSKKPGSCTITIKTADDTSITKEISLTVNNVPVTGIDLYAREVSLSPNDKLTSFRAWVLPENATNTNITYSSNDSTVAEVSKYGTITAKKAGTAVISCVTEDGGYTGTCTVNVRQIEKHLTSPSDIEFAIDSDEIEKGSSFYEQLISYPENLTETVSIESFDPSILTISNVDRSVDGMMMFDINAISKGTTSIKVSGDISHISNSYEITVISTEPVIELTSITVSPTKTEYYVGDLFSFKGTVTAFYSNGTSKVINPTSISKPNMSTPGTKSVTVTYEENGISKSDAYNIHVTALTLDHIEYYSDFDPDIEEHFQNVEYYCHGFVRAFYNNGSNKVVEHTITKYPDVSKLGVQDVTISYSEGGITKTYSYQVKIVEDKVTGIYVKKGPNKTNYVEGEVFDPTGLVITVYKESGNDYDLSYSLSSGITYDTETLTTSDRYINIYFGGYSKSIAIYVEKASTSSSVVPPTSSTTVTPPTSETTVTPPTCETTVTSVTPTSTSDVTSLSSSGDISTSIMPPTSSSQGGGGQDDPSQDDNKWLGVIIGGSIGAVVIAISIALPLILLKKKH